MIKAYDRNIDRKVRVFISSTFSDMSRERNIIVNSVFPRLRQEFSKDMIDITEVDLRWGIPEDITENNRILEICIGEVLHCAPFFVGIVGDRYGSTASEDAIQKLPPYYRKALGEDIPDGVSITELEMRAGVFCRSSSEFSAFYVRKYKSDQADNEAKVLSLRKKIISNYDFEEYEELSVFEDSIYQRLKSYINKILPQKLEIPYGDNDYYTHLRIMKAHTTGYVPDRMFVANIKRRLCEKNFLYVRGNKGIGKSALLSWIIYETGVEENRNVFFHYSSAGCTSPHLMTVYSRTRLFLEETLGVHSDEKDPRIAVTDLISKYDFQTPVFLFIDAVEQLDDVTAVFQFKALSEISDKVKVVCSGTDDFSYIFGSGQIEMNPLSYDQIRLIITAALNRFGKKLSTRMRTELMRNDSCKNPLFLKALISQLRIHGSYDSFEDYFSILIQNDSFDSLFTSVIERLKLYFSERSIPEDNIDKGLALIIYSYKGIEENELGQLLDILPVVRSVFLSAIRLFIIDDNGLIRFNHDLIVEVVKEMLDSKEEDYEKWVSNALIDYLQEQQYDWRRFTEETYQLYKTGDHERLYQVLTDSDCYHYLLYNERSSLIGYLAFLNNQRYDLAGIIDISSNDMEMLLFSARTLCDAGCNNAAIVLVNRGFASASKEERFELLEIKGRAQYHTTEEDFQAAIRTFRQLIAEYQQEHPEDIIGLAKNQDLLAETYATAGRMKEANRLFYECAGIYLREKIENASVINTLSAYCGACYATGKLGEAFSVLENVIRICIKNYGRVCRELARAYCYGWSTLYVSGAKTKALELAWKSYNICKLLYLKHGPDYAWAAMNAGTASWVNGDVQKAKELYLRSIQENDAMIPEQSRPHVYTLTTYTDLSGLHEYLGDHELAVKMISFTLSESKRKNGPFHIHTANIYLQAGIIGQDSSLIEQAITIYEQQEEYAPDLHFARICMARILQKQDVDEAIRIIDGAYEKYKMTDGQTDYLNYLFLSTIEKISGNMTEEMAEELDRLFQYDDYELFLSHSNNSCAFLIPEISAV